MARPPDPAIRKRLLDLAIDYVLTHGMADLSLRPLAKALKTNARMLVYHFGSREELMRQILEGLREREDARIQARPALRLIFELYALALRDPEGYTGVLNDPLAYWRKLAGRADGQANAIRENSGAEATLLLAATRGLLFDLCATEDRRRVSRAMKLLAALLEQRPRNS